MSGLIGVPIVVEDAAGRRIETRARLGVPFVALPVGPCGAIVFERTAEKMPITGYPIYRQQGSPKPVTVSES